MLRRRNFGPNWKQNKLEITGKVSREEEEGKIRKIVSFVKLVNWLISMLGCKLVKIRLYML